MFNPWSKEWVCVSSASVRNCRHADSKNDWSRINKSNKRHLRSHHGRRSRNDGGRNSKSPRGVVHGGCRLRAATHPLGPFSFRGSLKALHRSGVQTGNRKHLFCRYLQLG